MELDGTLSGTSYLIDAVRDVVILNVGLISGIVEDERVVVQGVIHPLAQFLFRDHRTCRVVGVAEIDDIHTTVWQCWNKTVLCIAWHIDDIRPTAILLNTSPSYHHIRVDIDRIDGVGDTDAVVPAHEFLYVTRVTLCTIIDKDFIAVEMNATGQEVVL